MSNVSYTQYPLSPPLLPFSPDGSETKPKQRPREKLLENLQKRREDGSGHGVTPVEFFAFLDEHPHHAEIIMRNCLSRNVVIQLPNCGHRNLDDWVSLDNPGPLQEQYTTALEGALYMFLRGE